MGWAERPARDHDLVTAALATTSGGQLLGGGGSGAPATAPVPVPPPPAPVVWDPSPLLFVAGRSGTIELSISLPLTLVRGGSFSLAPSSSSLAAQISLAADGILSATSTVDGLTPDVVFSYVEPG